MSASSMLSLSVERDTVHLSPRHCVTLPPPTPGHDWGDVNTELITGDSEAKFQNNLCSRYKIISYTIDIRIDIKEFCKRAKEEKPCSFPSLTQTMSIELVFACPCVNFHVTSSLRLCLCGPNYWLRWPSTRTGAQRPWRVTKLRHGRHVRRHVMSRAQRSSPILSRVTRVTGNMYVTYIVEEIDIT